MRPRISHNRYYNNKPFHRKPGDQIPLKNVNKIVSVAWTIDKEGVLSYGATVWKKENKCDNWKKRLHAQKASERLEETPVRIKMDSEDLTFISNHSIDWLISDDLVYKFGCCNKHKDKEIDAIVKFEYKSFMEKYDPWYQLYERYHLKNLFQLYYGDEKEYERKKEKKMIKNVDNFHDLYNLYKTRFNKNNEYTKFLSFMCGAGLAFSVALVYSFLN